MPPYFVISYRREGHQWFIRDAPLTLPSRFLSNARRFATRAEAKRYMRHRPDLPTNYIIHRVTSD